MDKRIDWEKYVDFDDTIMPPGVMDIIIVKGSYYEMGYQYGTSAEKTIKRNFCQVAGDALGVASRDEIENRVRKLLIIIEEKTPEIADFWKGIAAGAKMNYLEIALLNLQFWTSVLPEYYMQCSTICATKTATEDANTMAGVNADISYNMSGYGVVLICYPEEGASFITIPQLAGQTGSNFAMNEDGLIITFTSCNVQISEHSALGYPDFISAMVYACAKSKTAKDAENKLKALNVAGGWIYLFADKDKTMKILEHTSAIDCTRSPGDFGENNYMVAANHFIHENMISVPVIVEEDDNSNIRYNTEFKLMEECLGKLNLEKMMSILGCKDYWDGKQWHYNDWSGYITPEMRGFDGRTGTRFFGVAENKEAYILQGEEDTAVSFMPDAKGKYCKIALHKTINETVTKMEEDAMYAAWEAAKRISVESLTGKEFTESIDKAKKHLWKGKNHLAKARLLNGNDQNAALIEYSKAASEFAHSYVISSTI